MPVTAQAALSPTVARAPAPDAGQIGYATGEVVQRLGLISPPQQKSPFDFNDNETTQPDGTELLGNTTAPTLLHLFGGNGTLAKILEWRRIPLANTLWPLLLLFFLPWTNLSCNDRVLLQQSGFQSCYGGATPTAQLRGLIERNAQQAKALPREQQPKGLPGEQQSKGLPVAHFSVPFAGFLAVGLALGLACVLAVVYQLRGVAAALHLLSLGCGATCFLLLVGQMMLGFPIDRQIQRSNEQIRELRAEQRNKLLANPFGRANPGVDLAGDLAADALIGFDVQYTSWFWCTLLVTFLSIPLLVTEGIISGLCLSPKGWTIGAVVVAVFLFVDGVSAVVSFGVVEYAVNPTLERDDRHPQANVRPPQPNFGPMPQPNFGHRQPKDVFKDAFKDAFKDVAKDMPKKGGGPPPAGPTLLERKDTLTQKDPLNHTQKPAKSYTIKLEAGKEYVIDMKAVNKFDGSDPYLFLLDPKGKEVAKDDDSGGFPDAQIRYTPRMSGEFTVQASCFAGIPPQGLAFDLTVRQQK
jgi:hypothetical protein